MSTPKEPIECCAEHYDCSVCSDYLEYCIADAKQYVRNVEVAEKDRRIAELEELFQGAIQLAGDRNKELSHLQARIDRVTKLVDRWIWASNLKASLPEFKAQQSGWLQCADELRTRLGEDA